MTSALGIHHLVEYYECDPSVINDASRVREILLSAAAAANATIVTDVFHAFSPVGVTGVVVIAESHVAVHTWPEYGYVALDIFSCSDRLDAMVLQRRVQEGFDSRRVESRHLERGRIAKPSFRPTCAPSL